jgi:hypothetical protein
MMNQNDDREGRELSDELEAHRRQLDEAAGGEVVNLARFEKMLDQSAGSEIAKRFVEAARDMLLGDDYALRLPGCDCDQEEGDSPCPVHGEECPDCGLCECCCTVDPHEGECDPLDLNDSNDFEVKP